MGGNIYITSLVSDHMVEKINSTRILQDDSMEPYNL
jgi:hypothetical protein